MNPLQPPRTAALLGTANFLLKQPRYSRFDRKRLLIGGHASTDLSRSEKCRFAGKSATTLLPRGESNLQSRDTPTWWCLLPGKLGFVKRKVESTC